VEYFARKINRPKWEPKLFMGPDDIAADAVTGCLKTTGNTLSLWECSNDLADIHRIALALALGIDTDRIDTIDVVLLPKSAFEGRGFTLEPI
jgi:hypothetical protein